MANLQDLFNEIQADKRVANPESYEEFASKMEDPAYAERISKGLSQLGYDVNAYEGLKKKEESMVESAPLSQQESEQPSETTEPTQEVGTEPTSEVVTETPTEVQQTNVVEKPVFSAPAPVNTFSPFKKKKPQETKEELAAKEVPFDDSYNVSMGYFNPTTNKVEVLVEPKEEGSYPYTQVVNADDPWLESVKKTFPGMAMYADEKEWKTASAQKMAKEENVVPPTSVGALPMTPVAISGKKAGPLGKILQKTLNWDDARLEQFYTEQEKRKANRTPLEVWSSEFGKFLKGTKDVAEIQQAKEWVKQENIANATVLKENYEPVFVNGRSNLNHDKNAILEEYATNPDAAYSKFKNFRTDVTLDYFDAEERYLNSQGKDQDQIRFERSKYQSLIDDERNGKDLDRVDEEFIQSVENRAMNTYANTLGSDVTLLTSTKEYEKASKDLRVTNFKIVQAQKRLQELGYDIAGKAIEEQGKALTQQQIEAKKYADAMATLNDDYEKFSTPLVSRQEVINNRIQELQSKGEVTREEEAEYSQLVEEFNTINEDLQSKTQIYTDAWSKAQENYNKYYTESSSLYEAIKEQEKKINDPEVQALVKIINNANDEKNFIINQTGVDSTALSDLTMAANRVDLLNKLNERSRGHEESSVNRFDDIRERKKMEMYLHMYGKVSEQATGSTLTNAALELTKGAIGTAYKMATGLAFSPVYITNLFAADDEYSTMDRVTETLSDASTVLDPFTTVRSDADMVDKILNATGGAGVQMLAMASGSGFLMEAGLGVTAAQTITTFMSSFPMNYQDNINSGMNPMDARNIALLNTATDALLEGIYGEGDIYKAIRAARKNIIKEGVAAGKNSDEIMAEFYKSLPKEVSDKVKDLGVRVVAMAEGAGLNSLEELTQMVAQKTSNAAYNYVNDGSLAEVDTNGEEVILTAIPSLLLGGAGNATIDISSTQERDALTEGILYVGANSNNFLSEIERQAPEYYEQNKKQLEEISNFAKESQKLPGYAKLDANLKAHVLSEMIRKKALENAIKNFGIEDPKAKEEITKIDAEIKQILSGEKTSTINQTPQENAVQKSSTGEVLQREPQETGEAGSQRKGVEPSLEGQGVTQEVGKEEIIATPKEAKEQEAMQNDIDQVQQSTGTVINLNEDGTLTINPPARGGQSKKDAAIENAKQELANLGYNVESRVTQPTQEQAQQEEAQQEITDEEFDNSIKEAEGMGVVAGSEAMANLQNRTAQDPKKSKIVAQASRAIKALKSLFPNMNIVLHESDESYNNAMETLGGTANTRGQFVYKPTADGNIQGAVHINLNRANARTIAHEITHAALLKMFKGDGKVFNDFKDKLKEIAKNQKMVITDKDGNQVETTWGDEAEKLSSRYETEDQAEEYLSELAGLIAEMDANNPSNKSILQKIAEFINKFILSNPQLNALGIKPISDTSSAEEVLEFFDTLGKKISRGEEIKTDNVNEVGEESSSNEVKYKLQNDFSDPVSRLTFMYDKNSDEFKKLQKQGYITNNKRLRDFAGKYLFLHQPDAAFSGMIYKNGELLVEGKGGVFYPIKFHKDGYFWASTDTTANKMAKDLNAVLKQNGGTIYMALTSAPYSKLMSSTTMSNAVLDFFSSKAVDRNFKINSKQLKSALLNAANHTKVKTTKNKKTGVITEKKVGLDLGLSDKSSLETIKSKIKEALGPDNSSFDDRKTFVLELTRIMAEEIKNDPSAVKQFGKLFSEGIQNKYFKGESKTGKLKISAANMVQAMSEMFTEPMLKEGVDRSKGGQVYAVLELKGKVKPVDSDKHESYPKAIQSDSDAKVKLHILKDRENWYDNFEDPTTGEIIQEDRRKKLFPTSGVSTMGLRLKPQTKKGGVKAKSQIDTGDLEGRELFKYLKNVKIEIRGVDVSDLFDRLGIDPRFLSRDLEEKPSRFESSDKLFTQLRNKLLNAINSGINYWEKEAERHGAKMISPERDFEFRKKMMSKYSNIVSDLKDIKKLVEEDLLSRSDIKITDNNKKPGVVAKSQIDIDAEDSPLYQRRTKEDVPFVSNEQVQRDMPKMDATTRATEAKGIKIEPGMLVGSRINLNAAKVGYPVLSLHYTFPPGSKTRKENTKASGGEVIASRGNITLSNVNFNVGQGARDKIAAGTATKGVMAMAVGRVMDVEPNFDGIELSFNPKREHLFVDANGRAVKSAEEVTVMGFKAYARGKISYFEDFEDPRSPEYIAPSRVTFAKTKEELVKMADDVETGNTTVEEVGVPELAPEAVSEAITTFSDAIENGSTIEEATEEMEIVLANSAEQGPRKVTPPTEKTEPVSANKKEEKPKAEKKEKTEGPVLSDSETIVAFTIAGNAKSIMDTTGVSQEDAINEAVLEVTNGDQESADRYLGQPGIKESIEKRIKQIKAKTERELEAGSKQVTMSERKLLLDRVKAEIKAALEGRKEGKKEGVDQAKEQAQKTIDALNKKLEEGKITKKELQDRIKELGYNIRWEAGVARLAGEKAGKSMGKKFGEFVGYFKGLKAGRTEQRGLGAMVSNYIKDVIDNEFGKKGAVSPATLKAISRRAATISNQKQLDAFVAYLDKVIANRRLAEGINEIQRQQKKLLNKIGYQYTTQMKQFAKFDLYTADGDLAFDMNTLEEYLAALQDLNQKVPNIGKMMQLFDDMYDIDQQNMPAGVDIVEEFKKWQDAANKLFNNTSINSFEDYRQFKRDVNKFLRALNTLHESGVISDDIFRQEREKVLNEDNKKATFADQFLDQINELKKELANAIVDQGPNSLWDSIKDWLDNSPQNFTRNQKKLIEQIQRAKFENLMELSLDDLDLLNQVVVQIAENGFVDEKNLRTILDRAEIKGNKVGKEVVGQIGRIRSKYKGPDGFLKMSLDVLTKSAVFWESRLGMKENGPFRKYIVDPVTKAINGWTEDTQRILKEYRDSVVKLKQKGKLTIKTTRLQDGEVVETGKTRKVSKDAYRRVKIGVIGHILDNAWTAKQKKKNVNDWLGKQLKSAEQRNRMANESIDELDVVQDVYNDLLEQFPDGNGGLDHMAVLAAFENPTSQYKVMSQDDVEYYNAVRKALQEAGEYINSANAIRNKQHELNPYYMPRQAVGTSKGSLTSEDIEYNRNLGTAIRSSASYARTLQVPAEALRYNVDRLVATNVTEGLRDYYLTDAKRYVNEVFSNARENASNEEEAVLNDLQELNNTRIPFTLSKPSSSIILPELFSYFFTTVLVGTKRTLVEFINNAIVYPLSNRSLKSITLPFSSKEKEQTNRLLSEFNSSVLFEVPQTQTVYKAKRGIGGYISTQNAFNLLMPYLMNVSAPLRKGEWKTQFERAFENTTGEKFNFEKHFVREKAKYFEDMEQAASDADFNVRRIIKGGNKSEQRQFIQWIPFYKKGRMSADNILAPFVGLFSGFIGHDVDNTMAGLGKVVSRTEVLDGLSQSFAALGRLSLYPTLMLLTKAVEKMALGDDDEKEEGKEMVNSLTTAEGWADLAKYTAEQLASTFAGGKYAAGGRIMGSFILSSAYTFLEDRRQKRLIEETMRDLYFVDPIDFRRMNKEEGYYQIMSNLEPIIKMLLDDVDTFFRDMADKGKEKITLYDIYEWTQKTEEGKQWAYAVGAFTTATQFLSLSLAGVAIPFLDDINKGIESEINKKGEIPENFVYKTPSGNKIDMRDLILNNDGKIDINIPGIDADARDRYSNLATEKWKELSGDGTGGSDADRFDYYIYLSEVAKYEASQKLGYPYERWDKSRGEFVSLEPEAFDWSADRTTEKLEKAVLKGKHLSFSQDKREDNKIEDFLFKSLDENPTLKNEYYNSEDGGKLGVREYYKAKYLYNKYKLSSPPLESNYFKRENGKIKQVESVPEEEN